MERRKYISLAFIITLILSMGVNAQEPHGGFVTVEGTKMKLNGGDFYFSGANSFSMIYSEVEAEEQFKIAKDLGLNVIRMWGFWNGETLESQLNEDGEVIRPGTPETDVYGHYVLQSKPGEYPTQGWRRLDYAIYLAHVYNMKLIIPLLNEWPEFGGLETYMDWVGLETPEYTDEFYKYENAVKNIRGNFWTSEEAQQLYFNYVEHLLNHVNMYTGVPLKDDPAIMIWEVMNEPRYGAWGGNKDATIVRDWIAEAAAFIKSIDKNHLVGTGEEGFLRREDTTLGLETYPWTAAPGEGVDFVLNAQIENIDVLGFHCWPFQWGLWGSSEEDHGSDQLGDYPDISDFAPQWIEEHIRIANDYNKPAYLGEFGLQILRREGSDISHRDLMMKKAYDYAATTDISGMAYWHITSSHDPEIAVYNGPMERKTLLQAQYYDDIVPHDLDFQFYIFCPEDETTCDIIKEYTKTMTDKVEFPDEEYTPPCLLPAALCDEQCIIVDSHPDHCGGCNVVCQDNQQCNNGTCEALENDEIENDKSDNSGCSFSSHENKASLLSILFSL
jgi:mannan endo-1,4-beta-mannosidase